MKILLVEDHEPSLTVLKKILSAHRHEVTTATSVAAALDSLDHQHFDLLISDLGLPDGSGYDLMRHLRAKDGTPGIALSGYGMDSDICKSHEAGFKSF